MEVTNFLNIFVLLCISICHPGSGAVIPNEERIIGGRTVDGNTTYPFMVALHGKPIVYADGSVSYKFSCGASIITDRWLITASHCVESKNTQEELGYAVAGVIDNFNWVFNMSAIHQVRKVTEKYMHPFYKQLQNDIALLYIDQPWDFDRTVQPIMLPRSDYEVQNEGIMIGFGRMNDSGTLVSARYLQEATVEVHPNDYCKNTYDRYLDEKQICVGRTGLTSCNGDSGGPFIQIERGRPVLVGVTSYGRLFCTEASVYVKVSGFVDDFILPIMRNREKFQTVPVVNVKHELSEAPFTVSIQYVSPDLPSRRQKICSGTILSSRWIITTAQCIKLDASNSTKLYVVAESPNSLDLSQSSSVQVKRVSRVVEDSQPNTKGGNLFNVGLLYLESPLRMDKLREIKLPTPSQDYNRLQKAFVAGYGVNEKLRLDSIKNNMFGVKEVKIVPNDECRIFRRQGLISDNYLCGKSNTTSCGLDVGGPLYDQNGVLIGISSSKILPCGLYPEIFVKAAPALGFIHQTMKTV